ncbi:glycosyltransferase family 2 protein [Asaia spathodeae]|uniref:Glycosyltransferase family 2 protein n=1 Tax=Asaia spathodeae TaxID=657016 RepID=A0ABX2P1Z9_9PROT|nr:glycosyltransferase family 2 protein [Asaia spathodeae]
MTSFQCRMTNGERVICTISRVVTEHQTMLCLDPANLTLSHHASQDASRQTLAMRWFCAPGLLLLVTTNGEWPEAGAAFQRGGWAPEFALLSAIRQQGDKVALKYYGHPNFLTAEIDTGRIFTDRTAASDWERFTLAPVELPANARWDDFATQFAAILQGRKSSEQLLDALLECPPSFHPALLDLLGDLLTAEALQAFAALFVSDLTRQDNPITQKCARLLVSLPTAKWLAEGFSRLNDFRQGRRLAIQRADASFDFMGFKENMRGKSVYCRGAELLSAARRAIAPTRTLALLATARDEGLYLLEWIAHHRRIGVEQFFIYTNDLTDGSDAMLRALAAAGEIIWIDNSGAAPERINMQDKAYDHALMILPEILDYRWCLVVDLDEVVLPGADVDYCLPPLLADREREGAEAIAMSWRVLTPNGHLTWAPGLSAERFVETETHPLIKTVFRTNLFSGASAHHPTSRDRTFVPYMTIDGERQKNGDLTDHDVNFAAKPTINAAICHYHVRSLEEYVWKFARGENDNTGVLKEKHFRYNNPGIFDLFTTRFSLDGPKPGRVLADDIHRGMRRLLAIPGVAAAQAEIERRFLSQSVAFVEQSARIMQNDDRIAADVRERWCALVDEWRELRGHKREMI